MAQTVTLSSVGTATIILDPVPRTTSVQISASAVSSLSTALIEVTLDTPGTTPAPTLAWTALSSAMLGSSVVVAGGFYTVLSPIGGVRINSTTAGVTWTLKALQSVTA